MTDRIVKHDYVDASDNAAQYQADQCNRQQVTIEQYMEYWVQFDIPVWTFDCDAFEFGLEPWKQVNDYLDQSTADENIYFVGELEVDQDYPLFIQRKDLIEIQKERLKRGD